MKRLLCFVFGHRYWHTGSSKVSGGIERLLFRQYECKRCRHRVWE